MPHSNLNPKTNNESKPQNFLTTNSPQGNTEATELTTNQMNPALEVIQLQEREALELEETEALKLNNIIKVFQKEYAGVESKSLASRMQLLDTVIEIVQTLLETFKTTKARNTANEFIELAQVALENLMGLLLDPPPKQPQPEFKNDTPVKTQAELKKATDDILDLIAAIQVSMENPALQLLQLIKCKAYDNSINIPDDLAATVSSLKDVQRNSEFWQCIHDGFMSGHGVSFLQHLQKYGAYNILFPHMTNDKQQDEKNDTWVCEMLKDMDSSFKTTDASGKHPAKLVALLITRDLSSITSIVEKKALHAALKTPIAYDKNIEALIGHFYSEKTKPTLIQGKYSPSHFKPVDSSLSTSTPVTLHITEEKTAPLQVCRSSTDPYVF